MIEPVSITEQSSEALAAKVVCYRILKLHKEAAKEAMVELQRRKDNGDNFNFSEYIEQKIKEIPEPSVGSEQIEVLKKTLGNIKNGNL